MELRIRAHTADNSMVRVWDPCWEQHGQFNVRPISLVEELWNVMQKLDCGKIVIYHDDDTKTEAKALQTVRECM